MPRSFCLDRSNYMWPEGATTRRSRPCAGLPVLDASPMGAPVPQGTVACTPRSMARCCQSAMLSERDAVRARCLPHAARGAIYAPCRSVAQPGRAPRSGRGGRRFKSYHSDHLLAPRAKARVDGSATVQEKESSLRLPDSVGGIANVVMASISATFWVTIRAVNDDDAAISLLAAHASPALPVCPIRPQPPIGFTSAGE